MVEDENDKLKKKERSLAIAQRFARFALKMKAMREKNAAEEREAQKKAAPAAAGGSQKFDAFDFGEDSEGSLSIASLGSEDFEMPGL